MAQYLVRKDGYIVDQENNITIPPDTANSHFMVYQLWLEGKDAQGNDLGTGPNTADTESDLPLADVKAAKIAELKATANGILAQTDWYVVRNTETATTVPSEITSYRASIRTYVDTAEAEIEALGSVSTIEAYAFNFPA